MRTLVVPLRLHSNLISGKGHARVAEQNLSLSLSVGYHRGGIRFIHTERSIGLPHTPPVSCMLHTLESCRRLLLASALAINYAYCEALSFNQLVYITLLEYAFPSRYLEFQQEIFANQIATEYLFKKALIFLTCAVYLGFFYLSS